MTTLAPVSDQSSKQIQPAFPRAAGGSYCVELPLELLDEGGDTLDWVIGFTLDILNAHHLELRIVASPIASVIAHTPGGLDGPRASKLSERARSLFTDSITKVVNTLTHCASECVMRKTEAITQIEYKL